MITREQEVKVAELCVQHGRGAIRVEEGFERGAISAVTRDGVEYVVEYDGSVSETRLTHSYHGEFATL